MPLSPHLQVYRPQITSVMSILHRLTGISLILGFVTVVFFLYTLAEQEYCLFLEVWDSPIGLVLRALIAFSGSYHFFNGIRHLAWDLGFGFDLKTMNITGWLVILLSLITGAYFGGLL